MLNKKKLNDARFLKEVKPELRKLINEEEDKRKIKFASKEDKVDIIKEEKK